MTLYSIDGDKLTQIEFDRESKLQNLTENNLEELFNLKFIGREVGYGDFRLDTLAFDEQTNSFVIIEYKKELSCSVIDQGFSYLSLIFNDKLHFISKYNEISEKPLENDEFDFSQTKVMIIAPGFTKYQKQSIEFANLPIELWKVRLYDNGCVSYDKIKSSSNASIKELTTTTLNIDLNDLDFTEEQLLEDKSMQTTELYYILKDRLLFEFDDLDLKIFKTLASYKVNDKIICTVHFLANSLKVKFFTKTLDDTEGKTEPVTGEGPQVNYSIKLTSEDDFDYFIILFKQVYDEKSSL